mgnify:CR=1 FL=1
MQNGYVYDHSVGHYVLIDTYRCLMQNGEEYWDAATIVVLIDTYRCLMQNAGFYGYNTSAGKS